MISTEKELQMARFPSLTIVEVEELRSKLCHIAGEYSDGSHLMTQSLGGCRAHHSPSRLLVFDPNTPQF